MTARNLRFTLLTLAVLAIAILIFLEVRKRFAASTHAAGPAGGSAATVATGASGSPDRRPVADPRAPRPPGSAIDDRFADDTDAGPRIYVMDDGTVVRDHRKNGGAPPLATTPVPPEQRTMNPELSARVYQDLSPKVVACGAQVPASARGADPFVYVNLSVEVDGHILSATDVLPVAHDVAEAAAGPLVACVREALSSLRLEAEGEPDRSQYVLQYPIRLR